MADKPVTREEKYLAYLTGDYKGDSRSRSREKRSIYMNYA